MKGLLRGYAEAVAMCLLSFGAIKYIFNHDLNQSMIVIALLVFSLHLWPRNILPSAMARKAKREGVAVKPE